MSVLLHSRVPMPPLSPKKGLWLGFLMVLSTGQSMTEKPECVLCSGLHVHEESSVITLRSDLGKEKPCVGVESVEGD